MTRKIILVFGIPGAGKTTLIQEALIELNGYQRLSGGSLINAEMSEKDRDKLRKASSNDILYNQELLAHNFEHFIKENPDTNVIFDGHCVVKHQETLVKIPIEIIARLKPTKILFLDVDASIIIEQRAKDKNRPDREIESVKDLKKLRDTQIKICREYEQKLGIELIVLPCADKTRFIEAVT